VKQQSMPFFRIDASLLLLAVAAAGVAAQASQGGSLRQGVVKNKLSDPSNADLERPFKVTSDLDPDVKKFIEDGKEFYRKNANYGLVEGLAYFTTPRSAEEYGMPRTNSGAATHNIAFSDARNLGGSNESLYPDAVFVTMQPNSLLVKMMLNPISGEVIATAWQEIGQVTSGLHGLAKSHVFPGEYWATLQFDNRIIRFKPRTTATSKLVDIWAEVDLTFNEHITDLFANNSGGDEAAGPHELVEYVDEAGGYAELWITIRDSHHVGYMRVDKKLNKKTESRLIPALPHPIFVVRPGLGGSGGEEFPRCSNSYAFVAQDGDTNQVLRINTNDWSTTQIPLKHATGDVPINGDAGNLVTVKEGPGCSVWFGALNGGGGAVYSLHSDSKKIARHKLISPLGSTSGFINLKWVMDGSSFSSLRRLQNGVPGSVESALKDAYERLHNSEMVVARNALCKPGQPLLLLLASSLTNTGSDGVISGGKTDALVMVAFNKKLTGIVAESTVVLPTQPSKAHRLETAGNDVWISTFEGTLARVPIPDLVP